MPGPLTGVRVVELPALGPVPYLGMLLADLGADVVRIDRVSGGNGLGELMASGPMGRGRRSLGIDLRKPEGAEAVLRLCDGADVLIEGFRPGVAERLGLGPEVVHARNPRLVYGRMTGWGQEGPLAATAGHDITYLAVTGLLHGIGPADGPPVPPINYVADFGGGAMFLAVGVLAALMHARATGEGQVIDAAMTEGAAYLGTMTRAFLGMGVWQDERASNLLDGGAPNYRCYECADGKFVAIGPIEPQFWAELVTTIGGDPATAPSPYDNAQWAACAEMLSTTFKTRTRDEWAAIFEPLDACVAPVLTLAEAENYHHNTARSSYTQVNGMTVPAPAPKFSKTQGSVGEVTPPGRDTEAVLTELGYSEAELAELREAGVIA